VRQASIKGTLYCPEKVVEHPIMNGLFLLMETDEGLILKSQFFQSQSSINDNLLLKIQMSHVKGKEFSTVNTPKDTVLYSRLHEFKDGKKAVKIIVGVDLAKDENPDDFKKFIIDACVQMPEHINKKQAELDSILTALFASQSATGGEKPAEVSSDLFGRLKERAKNLMSEGKSEEAIALLDKAKTVPGSLLKLMEKGAKLIKQQKIEEAQKAYSEAIDLALSIQEGDMAAKLQDDLKRLSERPKFIQNILDLEGKALKALREENFKRASDFFREAAQSASKLGDLDAMNEFTKKSQCLMEFYQADLKKNRSF
jgi:tetratricopeptide (TPR) repeat protein